MTKYLTASSTGIALGSASAQEAYLTSGGGNVLQHSGASAGTLCRVSGVDQPQADSDVANRQYAQSYVLSQIRGLQLKQGVKLRSTSAVSLASSTTDYEHAGGTAPAVDPGNIARKDAYPTSGSYALTATSGGAMDPKFLSQ